MADRKIGTYDRTKPARTKGPVVDAADLSGAWGILEIKNRLSQAGWPDSARIVNIDPAIRKDLILVLRASGLRVAQTNRDRRLGRLVVYGDRDRPVGRTGLPAEHSENNSQPEAEETNARHHSKAD